MSRRLLSILELAAPQRELWDVGCDHGLLGLYALAQNRFSGVHFVDPLSHQIGRLKKILHGNPRAFFYNCRGQELRRPVCGTLVMAGFGGEQMTEIVSHLQSDGLLHAERLILSAHKDREQMLDVLHTRLGVCSSSTSLVVERGRVRQIDVIDLDRDKLFQIET